MKFAEELSLSTTNAYVFDVECYVNLFFVAFKQLNTNNIITFEHSEQTPLNYLKLATLLHRSLIVGFNSTHYDLPMITLALKGATCEQLKEASDFIIKSGIAYKTKKVTQYDFEKKYRVTIKKYNHIDLFDVCPVNGGLTEMPASLKLYAARLHAPLLQDLPYPPDTVLTQAECQEVRTYCKNDLQNTELLLKKLDSDIALRVAMSEQYGIDLRSKSEPQIAEAVFKKELGLSQNQKAKNFENVRYKKPDFVEFQTKELNEVLETVENLTFELDSAGSPVMPAELENLKIRIGKMSYQLSMGGLHSVEKGVAHVATNDIILADNDVESFYPRTILNQKLYPEHLGISFLTVFDKLVTRRIEAKKQKQKTISDSLKVVIVGIFGKTGNKYSLVYAPDLLLQITLSGQLALLMLIEALERIGIEVVSANTDGFVSKYPKERHEDVRRFIAAWEAHTGYTMEETRYRALYSRDVNSYIAIKEKGDPNGTYLDERLGCKTKGAYCERGSALNSVLSKNPTTLICVDAALQFLTNGITLEKTIRSADDIRRFVSVRSVRGGGQKDGIYLGKAVRWYYAKDEVGFISYVGSGNKVAETDGAKPAMTLPVQFPQDIDYERYIKEAQELLYDCGAVRRPGTLTFFDF